MPVPLGRLDAPVVRGSHLGVIQIWNSHLFVWRYGTPPPNCIEWTIVTYVGVSPDHARDRGPSSQLRTSLNGPLNFPVCIHSISVPAFGAGFCNRGANPDPPPAPSRVVSDSYCTSPDAATVKGLSPTPDRDARCPDASVDRRSHGHPLEFGCEGGI